VRQAAAIHAVAMPDHRFALTSEAVRRQLAAMPHDSYLIRLIQSQTHRPLPGRRLWTTVQLLSPATIGFLRARNREGYDVYIHPDAWDQNAGYVLVDLDRAEVDVVDEMRRNGHPPCLVVQTSPGHLQAWIQVSLTPLEPYLATAAARLLACQYGGDLGSADWRHLGRLAGFTNQKPSHRSQHGRAPWVKIVYARAGLAPHANALLQSASHLARPAWRPVDPSDPTGSGARAWSTAAEAIATYQDCLRRWHIAERFGSPNWNVVDLWVARHLLRRGLPAVQVAATLQLGSPQFPRCHGNPTDYLRRTLALAASPPRGDPV
jgi:hypothetical protein